MRLMTVPRGAAGSSAVTITWSWAFLDQFPQSVDIVVTVLLRPPLVGRLLADELRRERHHFLIELDRRHLLEERIGFADLVGVAQDLHSETFADRSDSNRMLTP